MGRTRDEREAEIEAQEDGADGAADQHDLDRRRRRQRFIDRVVVEERRHRRLVNLHDLAKCALPTMAIAETYAALIEDIRLGEFQTEGRDRVLYLSADIVFRMSPRGLSLLLLTDVLATEGVKVQRLHFSRCWTTRALARRWCERHGSAWPAHLEPEEAPDTRAAMQQRGGDTDGATSKTAPPPAAPSAEPVPTAAPSDATMPESSTITTPPANPLTAAKNSRKRHRRPARDMAANVLDDLILEGKASLDDPASCIAQAINIELRKRRRRPVSLNTVSRLLDERLRR